MIAIFDELFHGVALNVQVDPALTPEWERYAPPRIYQSFPLLEISGLCHLGLSLEPPMAGMMFESALTIRPPAEDEPCHYVLLCHGAVGQGTCHILSVGTAEIAQAIGEATDRTFDYVYTQAVLGSIDDSIVAALDGRRGQITATREVLGRKVYVVGVVVVSWVGGAAPNATVAQPGLPWRRRGWRVTHAE